MSWVNIDLITVREKDAQKMLGKVLYSIGCCIRSNITYSRENVEG